MELCKPILKSQSTPVIRKRTYAQFTDENGIIRKGILKSNDGYCVVVEINRKRIRMSRKEIKIIKE